MTDHNKADDQLWTKLLSSRSFYAYEFERNSLIENYYVDFFCKELQWTILMSIRSEDIRIKRKTLEVSGYHVTILHAEEVHESFEETISLLTTELQKIIGQPCGGW